MAEQPAVNRQVLGSSPSQGALTFSPWPTAQNQSAYLGVRKVGRSGFYVYG